MVTRKDVAKLAGTSTAVVTYVVNNGPRPVAPATRQRVLAAIAELDYRPNTLARALRAGTSHTAGLIVPDNTNPYFAELAHAIEDVLFDAGHSLLLCNSADSPEREARHVRVLADRQVDTLLLVSLRGIPDISHFTGPGRRAVVLHQVPPDCAAASIGIDDQAAFAEVVDHLRGDHGYRDLAMVSGPVLSPASSQRERAWQEAGGGPVVHVPFTLRGGHTATTQLLTGANPPRAILAANDTLAVGALRAAADLGVSVPDQLAVTGFDGTAITEFTDPAITTVEQPVREIAEQIGRLIDTPPADRPARIVLSHRLITRASCGCPHQPAPASVPTPVVPSQGEPQ